MNNKEVKPPVLTFGTEQVQLLRFDSQVVHVRLRTIRTNCQQSKFKRLKTIENDEKKSSRLARQLDKERTKELL